MFIKYLNFSKLFQQQNKTIIALNKTIKETYADKDTDDEDEDLTKGNMSNISLLTQLKALH